MQDIDVFAFIFQFCRRIEDVEKEVRERKGKNVFSQKSRTTLRLRLLAVVSMIRRYILYDGTRVQYLLLPVKLIQRQGAMYFTSNSEVQLSTYSTAPYVLIPSFLSYK
jgi:hypothetical protein